jgi:hypothetical protein
MIDEKKVNGYALCMIQDPEQPNLIFVGTEQGLYISFDNGINFQQFKNGYPSVSTFDLAIQEREADLAIASFGRALFVLDDIRPLRKLAANNGKVFKNKITAFDAPPAYQANFKNASGIEYSTWGTYEGENKKSGAALSFYVHKTNTDTGKNKLADTAVVKIFNAENKQVRMLKVKADSGFNRFYWGMEGKGIRQVGSRSGGRRGGSGNTTEPGGLPVDPGTYKVVISLSKENTDSMMVVVNDNPMAPVSKEIRDGKRKFAERLDKTILKLTDLTDRLTESDEIIKKIESSYNFMEKKDADTLRKVSKAMTDSIKAIREIMNGKLQDKQGYGQIPQVTVSGTLQEARSNILGKNSLPGAQEERLVVEAEMQASSLLQKATTFFNSSWKAYQTLVESIPVKLFKEPKNTE